MNRRNGYEVYNILMHFSSYTFDQIYDESTKGTAVLRSLIWRNLQGVVCGGANVPTLRVPDKKAELTKTAQRIPE